MGHRRGPSGLRGIAPGAKLTSIKVGTANGTVAKPGVTPRPIKPPPVTKVTNLAWEGAIPAQKWMSGQLAGAFWGESNIPESLRSGLARMDMLEGALAGIMDYWQLRV